MSDTWELWELGPHDCTKPHEWPFGLDTLCEGGKRVVLRKEPTWIGAKEALLGREHPNHNLPDDVWVEEAT